MNLATFNIYWYPKSSFIGNSRDDADQRRIAGVLQALAAQVIVFQEIVDVARLEALLQGMGGRNYQLREPGGKWLVSGKPKSKSSLKIVCAYDANALDLVAAATLVNPQTDPEYKSRRDPLALHFRVRPTGWAFTLVAVHLKSGLLTGFDDDARIRQRETAFLAGWLNGSTGLASAHFHHPPTEAVIVMGDFNALKEHLSLAPLHEAELAAWHWCRPSVVRSCDPAVADRLIEDPAEQWSTFLDREVIDHVIASPQAFDRIRTPQIYAFDLDTAWSEDPPAGAPWLRRITDYQIKGIPRENLYRISDHRPVRVTID